MLPKDKIKLIAYNQLKNCHPDGYWWYTLEATEYICAESIFLAHFMGVTKPDVEMGLIRRILATQREDGTWALYYNAKPDLSATIECYWALKLSLKNPKIDKPLAERISKAMATAKDFIQSSGGITNARVFTKIHLALHGLVPWDACPAMPTELMLMPTWAPVNIYEFSSWARACIIPLLVIMNKKPTRPFWNGDFNLEELFAEAPDKRDWNYKAGKDFLSWENFFIKLNKVFKAAEYLPFRPFEEKAVKKCEEWICEHIAKTEDIYPALAYGAMALSAIGHSNDHPIIKKALRALDDFKQAYEGDELPANANLTGDCHGHSLLPPEADRRNDTLQVHQQCCISPVWDTPWQLTALLEAGIPADHPTLLKSGSWLVSKQITKTVGDWQIKNPNTEPGGWSFEFENEYFPDVDDTIQVLHILNKLTIPQNEKSRAINSGVNWLISMQNDDGGWAAFDRNNNLDLVNRIPFSDHGACLDPSSPDITGRALTLLAELDLVEDHMPRVEKALRLLERTQEKFGAWTGRWGVNYIYGTWCVLTAISALSKVIKLNPSWGKKVQLASDWLRSVQCEDGGFSESPETYREEKFVHYPTADGKPKGVASQTAWALMGLVAAGEKDSPEAKKAAELLLNSVQDDGSWKEKEFTGTGFPNHFYIRYHGYRYFFPLLALAKLL